MYIFISKYFKLLIDKYIINKVDSNISVFIRLQIIIFLFEDFFVIMKLEEQGFDYFSDNWNIFFFNLMYVYCEYIWVYLIFVQGKGFC